MLQDSLGIGEVAGTPKNPLIGIPALCKGIVLSQTPHEGRTLEGNRLSCGHAFKLPQVRKEKWKDFASKAARRIDPHIFTGAPFWFAMILLLCHRRVDRVGWLCRPDM